MMNLNYRRQHGHAIEDREGRNDIILYVGSTAGANRRDRIADAEAVAEKDDNTSACRIGLYPDDVNFCKYDIFCYERFFLFHQSLYAGLFGGVCGGCDSGKLADTCGNVAYEPAFMFSVSARKYAFNLALGCLGDARFYAGCPGACRCFDAGVNFGTVIRKSESRWRQ